MTLRNSNRAPSAHEDAWRQDIVSYRRARLHRSLARLRTHPAVNPSGPHGPHGRVTSSPSTVSSCASYPVSHSLTPMISQTLAPDVSDAIPSGIIPALFNELVRRELGFDSSKNHATDSARLTEYLSAARAVTTTPSLSDPYFITRLATGNEPTHLTDGKRLGSLHFKPPEVTRQSLRARDIHVAIQKARLKQVDAEARMKKPRQSNDSPNLRRSTRKRLRSQIETVESSNHHANQRVGISDAQAGELEAFRPTPESAPRTHSEAARSRRPETTKTPSECCFCPDPQRFAGKEIQSELIGPFVDRRGKAKLFVHFDCACWAPQVYTDPANGHLRRVYDEYCRGRKLKCSSCGEKGATIGCYIQRCKKVFHYRCLEPAGAYCIERFFAAFCETHAHLGKKPSYKILMEAATIADVSAAQRKEDTTYGLDAPHSRYTLLRRRETEVIFSRKWRVTSHAGAFDTGRVVFSHRRKVVLGKNDTLHVGDCVRVLRSSALDIATGRLAYMALAQKGEASGDVSAVEARAAIASRENTGLLLLRNLRKARQWGASQIEVVRSIPIDSNISQASRAGRSSRDSEGRKEAQEDGNVAGKYQLSTLSGEKLHGLQASTDVDSGPERKRLKLSAERSNNKVKSSTTEPSSETAPSAPLPCSDRKTRENASRADAQRNTSNCWTQTVSEKDALQGSSGRNNEPVAQKCDKRLSPQDSNSDLPSSLHVPTTKSQRLTRDMDGSITPADSDLQAFVKNRGGKQREAENQELDKKVKSAWQTFLDEQLPRERLLRPDDSIADSLRNMARLWSMMTPVQRITYEKRGQTFSSPTGSQAYSPTAPNTATGNAGLFSGSRRSHTQSELGLKLRLKMKEPSTKRQSSMPLSGVKTAGRDDGSTLSHGEQLNWDNLFPTTLEENPGSPAVCRSANYDRRHVPVDRVRAPPKRTKARSCD